MSLLNCDAQRGISMDYLVSYMKAHISNKGRIQEEQDKDQGYYSH